VNTHHSTCFVAFVEQHSTVSSFVFDHPFDEHLNDSPTQITRPFDHEMIESHESRCEQRANSNRSIDAHSLAGDNAVVFVDRRQQQQR
jgi:hypothetical protein